MRELRTIALLAAALIWCGTLIAIRMAWTQKLDYAFLVWNLGLASLPLFFSTLVLVQQRVPVRLLFGLLWLLFLPNAPYIITDLMHIRTSTSGPLWLDVMMLSSCAATGLALGYCSIMQIHRLVAALAGPLLGWVTAITAMFLSGFGIYLGRFLRWRSIDIATDPFSLIVDITERLTHPILHFRASAVTLGFGVMLSLGYLFFVFHNAQAAPVRLGNPRSTPGAS